MALGGWEGGRCCLGLLALALSAEADTTRILLIHDGKFSSRITEKPSVNNICDGFRNHHGLSIMD